MNKFVRLFLLTALFLGMAFIFKAPAFAQNKQTIICGDNEKCDTSTHRCLKCKFHSSQTWRRFLVDLEDTAYFCQPKSNELPSMCSVASAGGREDRRLKIFGGAIDIAIKEGKECIVENFTHKYSYCYGCDVVKVLADSFVTAAGKAYDVSRDAANAVLIIVSVLWLASFALKNVSSFTTVEPMKMLQDLMVQFFKIILAFVIINSGLQTILHYSLVPLMNAGTDFGNAILLTVDEADPAGPVISRSQGGGGATSLTGGAGYSGGGTGGGAR